MKKTNPPLDNPAGILDACIDPVILMDAAGVIQYCNPAAVDLLGWKAEELPGRNAAETICADTRKEIIWDNLAAGKPFSGKLSVKNKNNEALTVHASMSPETDAEGRVYRLLCIFRPISSSDESEKALIENQELFKSVLESSPDAITVADPDGTIIICNEAVCEHTGYSRKEIIGMNALELTDDKEHEKAAANIQKVLKGNRTQNHQYHIKRKDGSLFPAEISSAVIHGPDNKLSGMVSVAQDITSRKKAEETLREKEIRLSSIFELLPLGLYEMGYNKEGDPYIKDCNRAACKMNGYPKEELIGLPIYKLETKIQREKLRQISAEMQKEYLPPDTKPFEAVHRRKDGTLVHVEVHSATIPLPGGKKIQIAIDRDITAQKAAEKKLLESQARLASIFDLMPDGLYEIGVNKDGDPYIKDCNKAACEMHGYSREELVGMPFYKLETRLSREWLKNDTKINLEKNRQTVIEGIHRKKDGTSFHVEARDITGKLPGGEPLMLAIDRDITERKKAEEERVRLMTAIGQAAEGIVITDAEGSIQYVNPALEKMTGYSSGEMTGQNPRILKSGEQDPDFYHAMWQTITTGDTWHGRIINKRKDGSFYTEDAVISPVRDNEGKITNFVGVKHDVSREVELEEQLRQSEKMEAIGHLAGGIAHDFNNILHGIIGYADLALNKVPPGSDVEHSFNQILKAGYRASTLVKQILSFSRQNMEQKEPIYLRPIIKEVIELMRAALPATIEMKTTLEKETKPTLADATKVHEVLMNLCTNASQAISGKGTFEVSFTESEVKDKQECYTGTVEPGFYSVISVSDTGDGIDPDTMTHIFEPFFTTKEVGKGTGMGLATVFGIIKSHNGYIAVESEPGKGTVFTVYLKKTDEPAAAHKREEDGPSLGGHERILVVDDEKMIRTVMKEMLGNLGYAVTVSANAGEALKLFKENPENYDLVITDQTMPEMTGIELSKEILNIRSEMPIILSTGYGKQIDEETIRAAGIQKLISKPYFTKNIAETIRELLDK